MGSSKHTKKFAFVGTTCSGKTTLFNFYHKRFLKDPRYSFVPEAAREYILTNTNTSRTHLEHSQAIQQLILEKELTAHQTNPEVIICDRSVLDSAIWVMANVGKDQGNEMIDKMSFWIPSYNFILLNPEDTLYKTDHVRKENPEMRMIIHQNFLQTFIDRHIPYHFVKGSVEERVQQIDGIIFNKINNTH